MRPKKEMGKNRKRNWLEFVANVGLPALALVAVVSLRTPLWDWLFGLDVAERAVASFEKSYGPDASIPVTPGDDAWHPLQRLIRTYTTATLPHDREPKVLARNVAVASAKTNVDARRIAQWTAPTTPVWLIYREWPGQEVPLEDAVIIGTIADLRNWVEQYRERIRFIVQDVVLTLLSVTIGLGMVLRRTSQA
jgi:hypothetical protein